MRISDSEFQRIANYVKYHYGIVLNHKRTLIEGRLENYLIRNGYNSYDEYMNEVERNPKGKEAENIVNVLTTNHTFFMRESEHFKFLKEVVLPQLKMRESRSKDICTWCAAASTGEEPYTLEMILLDYFKLAEGMWDTTLLATDISTKVLEFAVKGEYLTEQIEPLPKVWKKCYFRRKNVDMYQVTEELKRQVIFRQFNLMDPLPFRRKFHIIFLRNVMIYFDETTKVQLLNRIYNHMEVGGYLFIGTTENIDKAKTRFQYVRPAIYQKIL